MLPLAVEEKRKDFFMPGFASGEAEGKARHEKSLYFPRITSEKRFSVVYAALKRDMAPAMQ